MATLVGRMTAGEDAIEIDDGTLILDPQAREALRLAWMRLPSELGGERRTITEQTRAPCPCGEAHVSRLYALAGDDGLSVHECARNGWLWCRAAKRNAE